MYVSSEYHDFRSKGYWGVPATEGQTYGIRTNIGNYAKARIFRVINRTDGPRSFQDPVRQVVVYR